MPFLKSIRRRAASGGSTVTPASPRKLINFFYPVFWATADHRKLIELMEAATAQVGHGYHFADNLFTWARNNSMLHDDGFIAAWSANAETDSDKAIIWRRYILACAGFHSMHLRGDFVECGAYTGVGIKTVVDYLGGPAFPKKVWLYDLFEHQEEMLHHAMPEHGPDLFERVKRKFDGYPLVRVLKGNIPSVFEGESPKAIAYLHIDLNEAPAEIAALDALFKRVVPGGIVILDDYEWSGPYRDQKLAEDRWFQARQYQVFPLPTGQGIVLKR
jgi:O-methyltransferase